MCFPFRHDFAYPNSPRSAEDSDFVQQMVKAASVAFGGGRPNDYPKATARKGGRWRVLGLPKAYETLSKLHGLGFSQVFTRWFVRLYEFETDQRSNLNRGSTRSDRFHRFSLCHCDLLFVTQCLDMMIMAALMPCTAGWCFALLFLKTMKAAAEVVESSPGFDRIIPHLTDLQPFLADAQGSIYRFLVSLASQNCSHGPRFKPPSDDGFGDLPACSARLRQRRVAL